MMSSNRHLGRIIALQTLYEYEFRCDSGDDQVDLKAILEGNLTRYEKSIGDREFVKTIVYGVIEHQDNLDNQLQPIAPEWPIKQIARVDRNILRLGLYELLFLAESVPPKVAINEAVELAKAFGSENSSKFINGVLGTAYRELEEKKDAKHQTDR